MEFMKDILEKGGPVMWPLLVCSLVSLTFVIERVIFWCRFALRRDRSVEEKIFSLCEDGNFEAADEESTRSQDAYSRILSAGIRHRQHGMEEAVQVEAGRQVDRMKQGLGVLDTIVTLAPLLGILGTVTGIIESLDLLGESGAQDPRAVTGGIAEALITTATGLIVAVITLVPYNFLVARVQREARRIEEISARFYVVCRRHFRGQDH